MCHSQHRTLDRRSFLKPPGGSVRLWPREVCCRPACSKLGRRALAKEPTLAAADAAAEVRSRNGILEATITAASGPVRLGDHEFPGMLYNGGYLPPTLRARLGDTLADHVPQRSAGLDRRTCTITA